MFNKEKKKLKKYKLLSKNLIKTSWVAGFCQLVFITIDTYFYFFGVTLLLCVLLSILFDSLVHRIENDIKEKFPEDLVDIRNNLQKTLESLATLETLSNEDWKYEISFEDNAMSRYDITHFLSASGRNESLHIYDSVLYGWEIIFQLSIEKDKLLFFYRVKGRTNYKAYHHYLNVPNEYRKESGKVICDIVDFDINVFENAIKEIWRLTVLSSESKY